MTPSEILNSINTSILHSRLTTGKDPSSINMHKRTLQTIAKEYCNYTDISLKETSIHGIPINIVEPHCKDLEVVQ